MWQVWIFPLLVVGTALALAVPAGRYLAWVLDGRYEAPRWLRWFEQRLDTGPQSWKAYALSLLTFNVLAFLAGFTVLAIQAWSPLNPDQKGILAPTTIFHTACSFLTNTQQQHYYGDVHFSYFSQIFFICWMDFLSPAIGLAALAAVIRGLRGDTHLGNFYLDLWRSAVYVLLPFSLVLAVLLLAGGVPMTLESNAQATILERGAMGVDDSGVAAPQMIARGPMAAILAIKQLGTNGGGFFGQNSCHPFENPTDWTNFLECVAIVFLPFAAVFFFGTMLNHRRHAAVLFGVMFVLMLALIGWCVYYDTLQPNPALLAQAERTKDRDGIEVSALAGLPVDQELGNLEGKELRFGTSAGTTWAVLVTSTSNGSVNAMHDSLNPLASLALFAGMWLNCVFSGVGVGLLNLLIYLIVAVFLAGLMVGRTPEYLTKKVEAREMKLAMLALLIHPVLILGATGLFAVLEWGTKATNNPGPHGFSEILYEFSSAASNNGSGLEGLGDTYGFNDNRLYPYAPQWDIACGLVILFGRFIPMIVALALAGSLATKKATPVTAGTLPTDTIAFGLMLLGTIVMLGALLFLPTAVLGPVAEHWGPIPFGG